MTKAKVFPHLRAAADSVEWGAWTVSVDDGPAVLVGDSVQSWDYASTCVFRTTAKVDEPAFLQSAELTTLSDAAVVVLVDCPSSGARLHAMANLGDPIVSETGLAVEIAPGILADRVRLSSHVVLSTNLQADGNRATRRGARLAESPVLTVGLEGEAHRFPTELVSFAALRLEPAAWSIRVDYESLADSFVGSVRLLVNRDHPAASVLMDPSAAGGVMHSALRLDIARQLIQQIASDTGSKDDVDQEDRESDSSLRAGLEQLADTFLSMDLASAVETSRRDPARFERLLQVGFEFLMDPA